MRRFDLFDRYVSDVLDGEAENAPPPFIDAVLVLVLLDLNDDRDDAVCILLECWLVLCLCRCFLFFSESLWVDSLREESVALERLILRHLNLDECRITQ